MNYFKQFLVRKWHESIVFQLYNPKDPYGKGRCCMMLSGLVAGIIGQLTGGLFLTSFLLQYGLDKSKIGILTFIPYMASVLNILSPTLFERFQRRKKILVIARVIYYSVNILLVTLLPKLIHGSSGMVTGFVILMLLANTINQLTSSGWSAWHSNFLEEEYRVDYFQITTCITSAFTFAVTLAISFLGDAVSGTENELVLLTVIRYAAFALALIDCFILSRPQEFPYMQAAKLQFTNIFKLPLKNRRFLCTVVIISMYNFAANMPNATLNAYLLEDLNVSYSLINGINACWFLFFIFFSKMWKKFIIKHYWYKAFGYELLMEMVTYIAFVMVTKDTLWIYVLLRLVQHFTGVFASSAVSSLLYSTLPGEDQTYYLSFYTITVNLTVFVSLMLGTTLAGIMGDSTVAFLGIHFTSTQFCLLGCAIFQVIASLLCFRYSKEFTPEGYYGRR